MPLTKQKKKLNKLIQETDSDDSEHELSFYVNDRVKLMKEVLKTIKPKKIKSMAPACLKNLDMEEINSMLLEELLGISNKRLKYIFNGQNLDEESSSSTNEDEPVDIISLDDISDDEFVINVDDDTNECDMKLKKVKKEHKHRKAKKDKEKYHVKEEKIMSKSKEKHKGIDKQSAHVDNNKGIDSNENLMSVLELLELQARARAIKSQLLIESTKIQENSSDVKTLSTEDNMGSDDDVIIENTKPEEIIITSSESEDDTNVQKLKESTAEVLTYEAQDQDKNNYQKVITQTNKLQGFGNGNSTELDTTRENISHGYTSDNPLETAKFDHSNSVHISHNIIEDNAIEQSNAHNDSELNGNKSNKSCENIMSEQTEIKLQLSTSKKDQEKNKKGKQMDNDETIVINLSDYEMEELK